MAFNIREFAKNALLTAQKHIDNALDIHNDDADNEGDEESDSEGGSSDNESVKSQEKCQQRQKQRSGASERQRTPNLSSSDGFREVDLDGDSSKSGQWKLGDESQQDTVVVDTEPNPIRDGHDSTNQHVYHYDIYSNSHSPDEDGGSSQHDGQNGSGSDGHPAPAVLEPIPSSINMDISVIEESSGMELVEQPKTDVFPVEVGTFADNTEQNPSVVEDTTDIRTIASSDIEVIRHMDDWSVASNGTNAPSLFKSVVNPTVAEAMQNSTFQGQQETTTVADEKAVLEAKIRHRDQKIEEMGRLIESLKTANQNLHTKSKQIQKASAAAEIDLQKKLDDKTRDMEDLLNEGKKLSEHSGRQAKEIRRLKQQLGQLEMVTAARDSALEELKEAHAQISEHSKTIAQIKDECEKLGKERNKLLNDLQVAKATTESTNQHAVGAITELEQTKAEVQRLEKALKAANRSKEEFERENRSISAKLLNKSAHESIIEEREKGLMEDLKAERTKNDGLQNRIRELEQRLDDMQNKQREFATEMQNANSPLLINIAQLEEKVISLERQNESLTRQLRSASETLLQQKRRDEESRQLVQNLLEEERHRGNAKTEELSRVQNECIALSKKLKQVEENMASMEKSHHNKLKKAEKQLTKLNDDFSAKQSELVRVLAENRELQKKLNEALLTKPSPAAALAGDSSTLKKQLESPERKPSELFREELLMVKKEAGGGGSQFHQMESPYTSERGMHTTGFQDFSFSMGSSTDHLRLELESAQEQLFQLRKRFENLLEMYGGCLETIEELRLDNDDLRQICKQQAVQIAELKCGPFSKDEDPKLAAVDEEKSGWED